MLGLYAYSEESGQGKVKGVSDILSYGDPDSRGSSNPTGCGGAWGTGYLVGYGSVKGSADSSVYGLGDSKGAGGTLGY